MAQACHIPIQLNLTDRHFKRHFSPNGTLPPRPAHRQPRDNSLKPRCFPRNLALRSARFPAIHTLARAQAESTHRLWPKPVRVCESSRLEKIEPPSRCPWRGAGRCKVTINHQIGGRCWMTAHGRDRPVVHRTIKQPLKFPRVSRPAAYWISGEFTLSARSGHGGSCNLYASYCTGVHCMSAPTISGPL
jgi:hypothetical protein